MTNTKITIIEAALAAWGRHDIDELLAHVSDDIEWHYQVGSKPVVGRAKMRKLLERLKDHQLDSQWRLVRHAEAADGSVLIEAVDDYRNPAGHRVQVPYMGVYEFDGAKIVAWRDYVDLGLMTAAEHGEPTPEWLAALITAT